LFKRRKPDDQDGEIAEIETPAPQPAASHPAAAPPAPRPADNGLGVPPFRPAPSQPGTTKDETMARSPFSTTPPAAPLSPQSSGTGLPPSPAGGPGAPNLPRPPGFSGGPSAAAPQRPGREQGERRTLVVGRGISVQGSVQDAERLVVEGTVEASNINAAELAINVGGIFKGEVEVEDAEIAGTIDGTLTVRGSLIVRSSGRVLGTARCRRLQVEDGGQITGRIEMLTGSEQPGSQRPSMSVVGDRIDAPRPPEGASMSA
jgi:cytoskeletal protein CcmA (bactofilin family)